MLLKKGRTKKWKILYLSIFIECILQNKLITKETHAYVSVIFNFSRRKIYSMRQSSGDSLLPPPPPTKDRRHTILFPSQSTSDIWGQCGWKGLCRQMLQIFFSWSSSGHSKRQLKGTVSRDFLTLVFFIKQLLLVTLDIPKKDFEFF